MIEIFCNSRFSPEKMYVWKVLCKEILNIPYHIHFDNSLVDYTCKLPNGSSIRIRDAFFSQFEKSNSYLCQQAIPNNVSYCKDFPELESFPVLFGSPEITTIDSNTLFLSIDIVGSSFFMLSRLEETILPYRDAYNRFPAQYSLAVKEQFISIPIVHVYAELFSILAKKLGITFPKKQSWTKTMSHDIDHIRKWNTPYEMVTSCMGDLIKRRSFRQCKQTLSHILSKHDPYNSFSFLMDECEKRGHTATFYFLPNAQNSTILQSQYGKDSIASIINRNHEIGIHFDSYTMRDIDTMKTQKELLENLTNTSITKSRQHYLQCIVPETFQALEICGITQDSSLYYRETLGFRTGMCTEHSIYDVELRTELQITELPLLIMDVTLLDFSTVESARNELHNILQACEKYHGNCTCLWHNSSITDYEWQQYLSLYFEFLDF